MDLILRTTKVIADQILILLLSLAFDLESFVEVGTEVFLRRGIVCQLSSRGSFAFNLLRSDTGLGIALG